MKVGLVPSAIGRTIGGLVRQERSQRGLLIDSERETTRVVVVEEAFGYEWMPKGLKKGSAACRWMDERVDDRYKGSNRCRRTIQSVNEEEESVCRIK